MSDARTVATQALDGLVAAGCSVAALAGRDGLPILVRSKRPVAEETFTAMGAAFLAAGEAALAGLGDAHGVAVLAGKDVALAAAGVDDAHLVLAVAPATVDAALLRQRVADACDRLRPALRS